MRITSLARQSFHYIPFLNVGRNGRTVHEHLSWLRGTIDRLPDGVDTLLITSDLQGLGLTAGVKPLLGRWSPSNPPNTTRRDLCSARARGGSAIW